MKEPDARGPRNRAGGSPWSRGVPQGDTMSMVRCCVGFVLITLTGLAQSQTRMYEFTLTAGAGTPVCEAYVERLNRSEFVNYPFCDRPEGSEPRGFSDLDRVPLSGAEVERLFDSVTGLLRFGDANYLQRLRESQQQRGLGVSASDGPHFARENEAAVRRGGQPLFYRFEPMIDIDNDGDDDDVVSWKQTGLTCGQTFSPVNGGREEAIRAGTHLVVLDAQGNLDVAKTKAIFGHPAGDSVTYVDAQGRERTLSFADRFRTLGDWYGAFVYLGVTYFDTFYGSTGDFANSRVDAPGITDSLAVMKHENQTTMLVCEIHWNSSN